MLQMIVKYYLRYNGKSVNLLYNAAGDPDLDYQESLSKNGSSLAGEYNPTYRFVAISSIAFKTNSSLYTTMAHEGSHAWGHHDSLFEAWEWMVMEKCS